jgi:hypothetical protein
MAARVLLKILLDWLCKLPHKRFEAHTQAEGRVLTRKCVSMVKLQGINALK